MIQIPRIAKEPPRVGNTDTRSATENILDYLFYLREQLNMIIDIINKNQNGGT